MNLFFLVGLVFAVSAFTGAFLAMAVLEKSSLYAAICVGLVAAGVTLLVFLITFLALFGFSG